MRLALLFILTALTGAAQPVVVTNSTPAVTNIIVGTNALPPVANATSAPPAFVYTPEMARHAEDIRTACIDGRRYVSGRIMQVVPGGLVVESGYTTLMRPPFNQSWVVRGNVSVKPDPNLVEGKAPDAVCVGYIFLTDLPKKPKPKLYDYVIIHGYPCGQYDYVPVPGIKKTIRRFSGGLETAVKLTIAGEK